ncbi:MAG: CRISPR-associated helicase Cas3' [Dehalococcoidia bacterium]|nr:CRISPR-associated helicase Cas3' [Dehalococcoidia bacterium]
MISFPYIAHTRKDGKEQQLLIDHLCGTANIAKLNASPWGDAFAYICGLAHDIGKYSNAFQERIRGKGHRVDHATAGGQLLYNEVFNKSKLGLMAAYCVMGHHGGLPNGGSISQDTGDDVTLHGRLGRCVEDYSYHKNELELPSINSLPNQFNFKDGFDVAFFIRMAFSALVDADWLDTERFCDFSNASRGGFSTLAELCLKLNEHTNDFLDPMREISELNRRRNELLQNCINASTLPSGLFTLTAPTGSGKTISSLTFALNHAVKHEKKRVIYVVPYNTIIEQNSMVFENLLGTENVLQHNSNVSYDGDEEAINNKRNSVENWDYPLIMTSSVQFFESLFASKPSKCRKLHNIAESVLIFDEAQMIPLPYLQPCVRAIKTLVMQYGCSAVLATATQSSLDNFFKPLESKEIAKDPKKLYALLRRATIRCIDEPLTDDALVKKLFAQDQVLCIVNTRYHAQMLFKCLYKVDSVGTFHLSTTMFPAHRKQVLITIRERLKTGDVCRVISTSLVEAGVDLDFETVYREKAGLDSIVQAAGRCNREGNRKKEESIVWVFTSSEYKLPHMILPNVSAYGQIAREYDDLAELDAIHAYFNQLHCNLGNDNLDSKDIIQRFNENARLLSFPFDDITKAFKLIDDSTQQMVYVLHDVPELEERINSGERNKEIFRELGEYVVSLNEQDIQALEAFSALQRIDESILLLKMHNYDEKIGVPLKPKGGQAFVC